MGWLQDLLQQVPLSAVMKERIALVEQKYQGAIQEVEYLKKWVAALDRENADLRAQIPHREEASLGEDLAHLLRRKPEDDETETV